LGQKSQELFHAISCAYYLPKTYIRKPALLLCAIFVLKDELNCTGSPIDTDRMKFCFTVGEYAEVLAIAGVMKVAYLVLRNRCPSTKARDSVLSLPKDAALQNLPRKFCAYC